MGIEKDWDCVRKTLLHWYENNKRDLPWRGITDPYKIWVSEVILQQTRVNQGMDYYYRFVSRFPDIRTLALAEEEEVLKYWQGLGYYSRARNMHATALSIMKNFEGIFPSEYSQLRSLKGVGEYTAAAIASLAWNKPYPAVDGNVFRLLSRLFAIKEPIDTAKGKKFFTDVAGQLMDKTNAGLFNQALIEFGALQCLPVSPDCRNCPLSPQCFAFTTSTVGNFPVRQNKTVQRNRYFNYFDIRFGNYTYLNKRVKKDIWQNLYEFPLIETGNPFSFDELRLMPDFRNLFPDTAQCKLILTGKKHVLSHQILYANFYEVFLSGETPSLASFTKVDRGNVDAYPVHRLMEVYLERDKSL